MESLELDLQSGALGSYHMALVQIKSPPCKRSTFSAVCCDAGFVLFAHLFNSWMVS